jgi:tyrosine ammonia-lyase
MNLHITSPSTLDCAVLEQAFSAYTPSRPLIISFADDVLAAIREAHTRFHALAQSGLPIYGVTTGFGPLVQFGSAHAAAARSAEDDARHATNLLHHLSAGYGAPMQPVVVRSAMFLRLQTLSHGASGVHPDIVQAYTRLLEASVRCDFAPLVPELGSLGASGDLTPLAHVAQVLVGTGECVRGGAHRGVFGAAEALREASLEPVRLTSRDALGLVNGTSFATAYLALACARAGRLLLKAEQMTGWLYRSLGCRSQALDERLHAAQQHLGQRESAENIRAEAWKHGTFEDSSRPLQEIYSIRSAPQILGACRESLRRATETAVSEIAGVDDNPVLVLASGDEWSDEQGNIFGGDTVLHGGNFQTQHIAFAADSLNAALTQAGNLVERQIDALLSPRTNGGAAPMLAWKPGATTGLAGAQLTATAIVTEMRARCQHYAIGTIPTNGGNQDIVPLGTQAARETFAQTERLAALLAIHSMALIQLQFLRKNNRAGGSITPEPEWLPRAAHDFVPLDDNDRSLFRDIERIGAAFLHHSA